MELLKKSLMPNSPHLPHLICAKNAVKNDLAVDSDDFKALKSFGLGWLIRKDLDRKNFKPCNQWLQDSNKYIENKKMQFV